MMTASRRHRQRIVPIGSGRASHAVWCAVLLLSMSHVVCAEESARSDESATVTASNQPVSITVQSQSTEVRSEPKESVRSDEQETAGVAPPIGAKSDSATPRSASSSTIIRRPSRDAGVSTIAVAEQTPWYRSGIMPLVMVMALVFALAWALKKIAPRFGVAPVGSLRVVGRAALSPKNQLVLVEVGKRLVLVGVSPDRVERITEITESIEVAGLTGKLRVPGQADSSGSFDTLLSIETTQFKSSDSSDVEESEVELAETSPRGEPLTKLMNRVRSLKRA